MGDICNCCMYDSCGLQLCISYDPKDYYKKHPEEEPHYGTMYLILIKVRMMKEEM